MKAHAPIYIAKHVWETCSSEVTHQASPSSAVWPGAAAVAVHTPDGTLHSQAQRPEELDPIQLMRTIMCAPVDSPHGTRMLVLQTQSAIAVSTELEHVSVMCSPTDLLRDMLSCHTAE